jgi:hypothetical protein
MTPIRAERVVDHGAVSVLLSVDAADAMIEITEREVTITLSSREATEVGFALVDAAEAVREATAT